MIVLILDSELILYYLDIHQMERVVVQRAPFQQEWVVIGQCMVGRIPPPPSSKMLGASLQPDPARSSVDVTLCTLFVVTADRPRRPAEGC